MMGQSLDIDKDPFRPRKEGEELLGSGYPYLSAIGALMYLANGIDLILHLLLTYCQGSALLLPKGIGVALKESSDIYEVRSILDYISGRNKILA
jgi:hypothetical protein